MAFALAAWLCCPSAHADDNTRNGAPPAAAQMEEARLHYSRGVQLYTDGSFEAALVELERANRLAPSYRILYSIGLVKLRLNDFAGASVAFQKYLDEGGANVPPARKTEVTDRLARLADRIGTIEIKASEDDAEVRIDDLVVGKTPLGKPIILNPGYHRIAISKSGYTGDVKQLGVAGGDKTPVEFQLTPIAPSTPAPLPLPSPAPPSTPPIAQVPAPPQSSPVPIRTGPPLWIGWTVTGALVAGAAVMGVAALNQSSRLTDDVSRPTPKSEIDAAHQKTTAFALASDILSGTAIVAAGVMIYLTLTSPRKAAASAGVGSSAQGRIGSPLDIFQVGPGRAGIAGRF